MEETPAPAVKTSVLIVSYNCASALRRCLEAVEKSQARELIEIFVIDNGSVDDSPALDADFRDITFLRLPRNFGLTKARNIGIRSAKGDYVFFLQPDVEVVPETIARLVAVLDAEPDAWAVCPLLDDAQGQPAPLLYPLPDSKSLYQAWRQGAREAAPASVPTDGHTPVDCPAGCALMVRKHYLKGMNYLDERYGEHWSDVEVCYQIRRVSKKILLVPEARAVHHWDLWQPDGPGPRALLSADCGLGAAAYMAKRRGFLAGLGFRVKLVLAALLDLLLFRDLACNFLKIKYLAAGQKIDGTQSGL